MKELSTKNEATNLMLILRDSGVISHDFISLTVSFAGTNYSRPLAHINWQYGDEVLSKTARR